jgi:hypothetical protein
MSWHRPRNWTEALACVESALCFHAPRIGVGGESIAVCSDARRYLRHVDGLGQEVIASNDRLHIDYLAHGRRQCLQPTDVVYMVTRDGRALAAVTRTGGIKLNDELPSGHLRFALARLLPALDTLAKKMVITDAANWI